MYLKGYNNLEAHLSSRNPAKAHLKFYLWLSLYDPLWTIFSALNFLPRSQQIYIPDGREKVCTQ